ncbi:hypothetical protein [Taklimakanibacter lacteus]|uniref:hypothetical protein n=1 Tax=Taklimakanibacter lacteus TaxID=2268456 RepID=UPI000E665D95
MSETEPISPTHDLRVSEPMEPPKPPANAQPGPLPYGGTQGKVDYMEARIASIEAHVDHMRDDIGDTRLDLREIAKSVASLSGEVRELDNHIGRLPGKGWMFSALLIFTAAICATIIYLEQIRQYLGVVLPSTAP